MTLQPLTAGGGAEIMGGEAADGVNDLKPGPAQHEFGVVLVLANPGGHGIVER